MATTINVPQMVLENPIALVENLAFKIEEAEANMEVWKEQARELVLKHGSSIGEGNSKKLGRVSVIETNTKPKLNQDRALSFLEQYHKDLLDKLTKRAVLPKDFDQAVMDNLIGAEAAKNCKDPASPSWQFKINKEKN